MQGLLVQVAVRLKAYHRVSSSTVPARVGIRRHIGTESYRFGRQYGASHRVGSHTYQRDSYRVHRRIGVALVNRPGGFSGSSTILAQVQAAEAAGV